MATKTDDLTVFATVSSPTCSDCGEELGRRAWITLTEDKEALCLSCADLDHLAFLPSGDAALTRRARKHSGLCAVVVRWSRARKRYERQGLLVEETAIQKAEAECVADAEVRERRRAAARERQEQFEVEYLKQFAAAVRAEFPGCPATTADEIAHHACLKHSGRIGRSADAKALYEWAVRLAVVAHVRHRKTRYDELLMTGTPRDVARGIVADEVDAVLMAWRRDRGARDDR